MNTRIFLFGEAERGELCTPLLLRTLEELLLYFGNAPKETLALEFAIQAILYEYELIFFRVQEEGFALTDYMKGVKLLYKKGKEMGLSAIGIPGVGDKEIIDSLFPICEEMKSILLLSEKDFYDYLTASK